MALFSFFFFVIIIMCAFVIALFSLFSVTTINNFVMDHLHPVVIAWFSFFSVTTINNFVLDHLHPLVMALFRFLSGPVNNFVLNHLYLFVTTLIPFLFTDFFNFVYLKIKNLLWDHLYNVLLVGSNVKALTPPLPVQLMPTTPIEFGRKEFETRLQEALNFLRDDNQNQGVLGIWGMGGVGKTTLLEHINDTLGKNQSSYGFDKVVFVTASRECTTEKIQSQIKKKLGLSSGETTDIFNYFHNKSFAILLDDLWEDQELKKVGIPLPLGMVGDYKRKLILTSRFEKVCRNMGAREPVLIEVNCLNTVDARLLFRSRVGEEVIRSDQMILKLADEVAVLCGGLPIALNAVGRAMAGVRDVKVWEYAVDELQESKSKFFETREEIAGTKHNPLQLLKFSYDQLKDPEKKECFLHCALWPEDFQIDRDELIKCWIGHGLLGKVADLEKTYRKGCTIIDGLQQACLLERVPVDNDWFSLRNQHVKLHDVIRDMALWIACDCGVNNNKWIVRASQNLLEAPRDKELWREAHKISLMYNKIESLPSEIQSSPNLTTLILKSNKFLHGGLRMSKCFNSLKYLDISGCYSLDCFPTEICGLTTLEYLNISDTYIRSLPEELKALVNMKYLIARGISDHLKSRVPLELLSNLVNLIELDLFWSGNEDFVSSVIDNLGCLEGRLKGLGIRVATVSNLQKLVQLSGIPIRSLYLEGMVSLSSSLELLSHDFLGSQHIWSNLKELVLYNCDSVVEVVVEGRHELKNIEILYIDRVRRLNEIKWKRVEPRDVLPKLREVIIWSCDALKSIEWVMYLPCLEVLCLEYCNEMEKMFGEEAGAAGTKQEEEDRPTFPSLRILKLFRMPKLSSICNRPLTFPSLEYLHISECRQLKKLPFHSPTSCTKLREIKCDKATWEGIDLEDNMQATLKPLLHIEY